MLNQERSVLEPALMYRWLAFIVDLKNGTFFAPEEKISKLRQSLAITVPTPAEKCSVRRLAGIAGKIVCMSL